MYEDGDVDAYQRVYDPLVPSGLGVVGGFCEVLGCVRASQRDMVASPGQKGAGKWAGGKTEGVRCFESMRDPGEAQDGRHDC